MKKKILFSFIFFITLISLNCFNQANPLKLNFEISCKDNLNYQAVLKQVASIATSQPQSSFDVVICGGVLSMVLIDKYTVSKSMGLLNKNLRVSF